MINQMIDKVIMRQKAAIKIPSILFMSGSYGEAYCAFVLITVRPLWRWQTA
jgi:hypothetical protein